MANLKYSRQREIILQTVRNCDTHPDADFVYREIRKTEPNISLATVYRNLNLLSEMGEIKKIPVFNNSDRFDKSTHKHYHLHCGVCKQIHDINIEYMAEIDELTSNESGYIIDSHEIVFAGICDKCQNDKKNEGGV